MTVNAKRPLVKNIASAPMIYFDQCPTLGVMNGVVELDVAARVLFADADGNVTGDMVCTGHLRCSVQAAVNLRGAIDKALAMANYDGFDLGAAGDDPSPGEALARRVKELNS